MTISNTAIHTFTISTNHKHHDVATSGDLIATSARGCAARKLARMLVEAEAPEGPIEARGTDGRLRYTVRSLYAFAQTDLTEDPLRVRRYRAFPGVGVRAEAA